LPRCPFKSSKPGPSVTTLRITVDGPKLESVETPSGVFQRF
jgi:hypothetical protein